MRDAVPAPVESEASRRAWPVALVLLGVGVIVAPLLFTPVGHGLALFGTPLDAKCVLLDVTGVPCPSCGMTRSWVHAVRGRFGEAWAYNPAGLTLWLWALVSGGIGAVRVLRRDPDAAPVPPRLLMGWVALWLVVIYGGGWAARLVGWWPLPGTP